MAISVIQAQMFFLALTRVMAVVIHVPILAGSTIPTQVRISLGILLTMVILPWEPIQLGTPSMPLFEFGISIGRELLIGTLAGFAIVLTFATMQIAAELTGLGSGFAAGRILNPALENTGSALDQLLVMITMLIFIVLNGHHSVILGLRRSFDLIPLNVPLPDITPDYLISMTAQFITLGVQIALPVMGALLLADITLGLLARVAPQMHVFFLGIPLKVAMGLLGLTLALPIMLPTIGNLFKSLIGNMVRLIGG